METPTHAPATPKSGRLRARDEPALLVEHAVVGQEPLAVDPDHPPPAQTAAALAKPIPPGAAPTKPTTRRTPPGGRRHLFQRGHVVGHEAGLEEQILGRVARNGQLGHHAHVGPGMLGRGERGQDAVDIARQVPDDGVQLRGGQAQVRHSPRHSEEPAAVPA
jgi:hypothetical protein